MCIRDRVYVGGGTPKNFIQQTEVTALLQIDEFKDPASNIPESWGHKYAIQFTTDAPQWGGLSGCTFEEAKSWGKVSLDAQQVMCFCDATIALPIVVSALVELGIKRQQIPRFELGGRSLGIEFD